MTPRLWKAFPLTIAFALLATIQPANAQSTCNDGTSSAASGRGACSGHGGVAKAAATSKKADRAARGGPITYSPRAGATVTCGDGTTSAGGRGACSHHGGIAAATAAAPAAPAPPAPANTRSLPPMAAPRTAPAPSRMGQVPSGASAQCRDGTYSYSKNRRGTCSHHGGVATWM
jgi:hypothetical protein